MSICVWCGKQMFIETISNKTIKYHPGCKKLSDRHKDRIRKAEYARKRKIFPKISTFVPMTDDEWYASDLFKKRFKNGGRI